MNSAHWILPSLFESKPSKTTLSSCLLRNTPNLDIISSNSSLSRTPLLLVSNCCKRYGYDFELNNLNFRNAWKMGPGMTLTSKTPLSWAMESTPFALSWCLTLLEIYSMRFLQSAITIDCYGVICCSWFCLLLNELDSVRMNWWSVSWLYPRCLLLIDYKDERLHSIQYRIEST